MRSTMALGVAALAAAALTGCGGGSPGATKDSSTNPGTLIESPPLRVASLNAADFTAQLSATSAGQQLLALAGAPTCGVDFHYFQYQTVGGKGEQTTASGAIMAPTGGTGCSGARPILVYTHGTAVTKSYDIANIADPTNEAWQESAMVAAFFAAHGYIVVASNYAGYDSSPLAYTPYLNADAESKDVINALAAARTALANGLPSGDTDNGKLFITGYSQGGHVAMATQRAMEAQNMTVTAAAPMSGPYAMLAFGDAAIAYSNPGLGGTIYYPMIVNSYQQSYGNVYTTPGDIFSSTYATGIDTLIPGQYTYTTLVSSNKLPQFAVFDITTPGQGSEPSTGIPQLDAAMAQPNAATNPIGALGFGDPYLFNNSLRVQYALDAAATPDGLIPTATTGLPPQADPTVGIRLDLKRNDLRGWTPKAPVMLCGGMNDPEVFYQINTLAMKSLWAPQVTGGLVNVVDVDPTTDGNTANAGQVATLIGTITAGVYASEPTAGTAKISADVQTAVVGNAAFSSFFSAPGVPNSPQGVMVLGLASVASQATTLYLGQNVTSAATLATDIGNAVVAEYHFPLTQTACETAAQAYFAHF
ncbi:MAG TPA: prolyl oligopeptidase family serine peptidase [Burkholderiaceae bacterium]